MSINHEQPLDLGVVYIVYRKHHSHPTTRTSHVFSVAPCLWGDGSVQNPLSFHYAGIPSSWTMTM